MMKIDKNIVITASFLGALTIAVGAFGAHGLKELIDNKSLTLSKHYISVKLFENDAQIIEYLKQNSNNAKQILDYFTNP